MSDAVYCRAAFRKNSKEETTLSARAVSEPLDQDCQGYAS